MPLNLDYVARETGTNLRRNLGLTVASILTVVVSLVLVGSAFLIRQGVNNAFGKWRGGIEMIVYMEPASTPEQREVMKESLEANRAEVKKVTYVNQEQAYEEAEKLLGAELLQGVTPEDLPPSYRVVPVNADIESIQALRAQYSQQAGVYEVVSADETIRVVQGIASFISNMVVMAAIVLGATAAVLIFNTIRMAMFARRREIEVMKLVGATNWFIRVPFIMEGMIQGLVGSVVAVLLLRVGNTQFSNQLQQRGTDLLSSFVVSGGEVNSISLILFIVGVLVAAVCSGLAASLYLDV